MVQASSRPHDRHAFKIAVICALPVEAGMVQAVFDEIWHDASYGKALGDPNAYSVGIIGRHNVVLAHMPGMGSNSAATVAAGLRSSFQGIEIAFVVGICGAVPYQTQEIFLGDCIVSTAVVQYDFGRQYPHGFIKKDTVQDSLGRAPAHVRSFTSMLATPLNQERLTERLAWHLETLQRRIDVRYPGWQRDRLFPPSYIHRHQNREEKTCSSCLGDTGICSKDCDAIGCDDSKLVPRKRYNAALADAYYSPKVHFGKFGSANMVMKSGLDRDSIAAKNELIAFEMEGSGVWDVFPTIVIKSASDYADSHKTKEWQSYAAATAAAGLKAILERQEVADSIQYKIYKIPLSLQGLPVTKDFIARPAEMEHLQSLFPEHSNRRKVFVLRGLGGIGKTQMAIEFMRLYHSRFSALLWLDGSSEGNLKRSLASYADKIVPGKTSDPEDIDIAVQEVLAWLALTDNTSWLVVFDNVDREFDPCVPDRDAYDIERYFPKTDHGSILVTTRLARLEQLGHSQEVEKVDSSTAQAILKSWYKKSYDDDDGKQLIELLDGLPLAIAQAGAYLQESGTSIKTYLRFYKEMQRDVESMLDSQVSLQGYPNRSVWTTWNISYEAIARRDEHVAHLLTVWSFLGRTDLWYGLFKEAVSRSKNVEKALLQKLGEIATREECFLKAMHLLRSYSLIESSLDTDGYTMHAVVHRWTYSYQGLKNRGDLGLLALALVGFAVPTKEEREYAPLQRRVLPHAQTCVTRVLGKETADVQALDLHAKSFIEHKVVLDAISLLGILYHDQGKLHEAKDLYLRALRGCEEILGPEHLSTLDTVHNLGLLYFDTDKLDEAEEMYMRALRGGEEIFGPKHVSTLDTIHSLGLLYSDTGKLDEAEEMCMRALRGCEETFGEKHVSTLNTIHTLGSIYSNQGRFDKAEEMYLRAYEGCQEALGAKHIATLDAVHSLGWLYKQQDILDKAEVMLVRALRGYEEALGEKHRSTLTVVEKLGLLYKKQFRLEESEDMFNRALQGYDETFGAKHKSIYNVLHNLGIVYAGQGDLDKSERTFKRALRGYEEVVGAEAVQHFVPALNTMWGLGNLYLRRPSMFAECREMYTKALTGYKIARGPSYSACVDLQHELDLLDAEEELVEGQTK